MKKAFYALSPDEMDEVRVMVESFINSMASGSSSEYDQSKSELLQRVEAVSRRAVAISDESWGRIKGLFQDKSPTLRKLSADIVWPPDVSFQIANELEKDIDDSDSKLLAQFLGQASAESASIVTLTR